MENRKVKKKVLKIIIEETEQGSQTTLNIKELTDFEVVGLLSYYHDAYKVKMMRGSSLDKQEDNE